MLEFEPGSLEEDNDLGWEEWEEESPEKNPMSRDGDGGSCGIRGGSLNEKSIAKNEEREKKGAFQVTALAFTLLRNSYPSK